MRIAFSVACGTVCLLLVALWVRSYWRWEYVALGATSAEGFLIASANGAQSFRYSDDSGTAWRRIKWHVRSLPAPDRKGTLIKNFYWHTSPDLTLSVPYWFLVAMAIGLAAAPWLPWRRRISLRELILVTTLVAVILVWAVR